MKTLGQLGVLKEGQPGQPGKKLMYMDAVTGQNKDNTVLLSTPYLY
jgi:hypothetical protein